MNQLPIEKQVGQWLILNKQTIATAESCTGGTIAKKLTAFSGSSAFFKGAVVAYANDIKSNVLHVSACDIEKYGAVSKKVVEQMASGVRKLMQTNYAIATSGIAGPTGATAEKPVGTVWIAVCSETKVVSQEFHFGEIREENIEQAATAALALFIHSFAKK